MALDICTVVGDYPNATKELLDLTIAQVEERGARGIGIVADVRDEEQVRGAVATALAQFGQIDVLVNNAGVADSHMLHEMPEDAWDMVLDVNLKGQALVSKHVVPGMIGRRSGSIINISSAVIASGMTLLSHYVASKHAVVGLTKALATELSEFGINVNCIAPGSIRPTDRHGSGMIPASSAVKGIPSEALFDMASERYNFTGPKWRVAMDDISDAVLFLASDNARVITGVVLPVDGGQTTK